MESTRIDRWLHSVRLAKSRSTATDACASGRVRVNSAVAKPATQVRAGDLVELRVRGLVRAFDVVEVIDRRVGAPLAQRCYLERTPDVPVASEEAPTVVPVAERERGSGRPTKRERRELDRLRGRRR